MQDFLNSTNFTQIFIALVLVKFLLETYLKIRNLKSIDNNKDSVPPRFKNVITEEEYKKSILYNTDRIKFQIITALFGSVVLVIFTIGGLLNYLTQVVMDATSSNVLGAVLLGLLLIIVEEIISIPISIYSTFVIEERHGFNKTTKKTFQFVHRFAENKSTKHFCLFTNFQQKNTPKNLFVCSHICTKQQKPLCLFTNLHHQKTKKPCCLFTNLQQKNTPKTSKKTQ